VEAHRILDEAVAAAYGWPADINTDDALRRLLEMNLARSAAEEVKLELAKLAAKDTKTANPRRGRSKPVKA
jgi:hypothetical protein